MDKEAASCPTIAAEQSPDDNMADGRTNEEVGERRKVNFRKRMALAKEEQEAKIEVLKKRRKVFDLKKTASRAVARSPGSTCFASITAAHASKIEIERRKANSQHFDREEASHFQGGFVSCRYG